MVDRQGAIDFRYAFYMWQRNNADCEYHGLQGHKSAGGCNRNRFLMMVGSHSPRYQQQWVASTKEEVNKVVLRPLASKHSMENDIQRQKFNNLKVAEIATMYMDDSKTKHPICFKTEQAREQFAAVLHFLTSIELNN